MRNAPPINWRDPVAYRDTLLADQTVHRRYDDGVEEWRRRDGAKVAWRDNRGRQGIDELLGDNIVKRAFVDGRVHYGREQGYGRTAWSDGAVNLNRTTFAGSVGVMLAAAGAGVLLGSIIAPPLALSAADELALRELEAKRRAAANNDSGSSGSGDSSWSSDDDRRPRGEPGDDSAPNNDLNWSSDVDHLDDNDFG